MAFSVVLEMLRAGLRIRSQLGVGVKAGILAVEMSSKRKPIRLEDALHEVAAGTWRRGYTFLASYGWQVAPLHEIWLP
jgi:hypothetical protein